MADESIVIEVKDSVDGSIANKIRAIGTEAKSSYKDLQTLQKQLSALGVSKLGGVSAGTNAAGLATTRLATAQAGLATATARLQAAQNQAALSAQRLADAQERASKRATAATQATAAAATASTNLNKNLGKQAIQFDKNGLSIKQYNAAMRGVPAQITDIVVSLQGGQRPLTVLLQQGGQLKDMFGGIRPAAAALTRGLIAMINPWTLLAAGVTAFAFALGIAESKMRVFNGLAAQFEATGRGDIGVSQLQELRKELAQLPGITKSVATEVIQEFATMRNLSKTTIGEVSKYVADFATATGKTAPEAAKALAESFNDPLKGAQDLDKALGFLTIQDFKTINSLTKLGKTAEAQKLLVDRLKEAIGGLAEESLTPMQKATNNLGNAWSRFTDKLESSSVFKTVTDGLIGIVNGLTWVVEQLSKLERLKPPSWLIGLMAGGIPGLLLAQNSDKSALVGGATGSWDKERSSAQMATTKSKTDAAGITGKKGEGESRVKVLAKINEQLDNEIKLLNLVGEARERYEMTSRINESLIGRGIKLTIDEQAAITGKIDAIVKNAGVMAESIRIYDEATGAATAWENTLKASQQLLKSGKITQEDSNRVRVIGDELISDALDPLRQFNKELNNQFALTKLNTKEAELASYMQQISNDLLAKGIDLKITDNAEILKGVAAIGAKKTALMEEQAAQKATDDILENSVGKRLDFQRRIQAMSKLAADPNSGYKKGDKATDATGLLSGMGLDTTFMQSQADSTASIFSTMYDQLKEMRSLDLISEQDYASAKAQIATKQTEVQLQGAKQFYGELVNLQSSSVREFAAIGKAAAIVQATINTYEGATKALAQGGIYGPIMAGAVIASGLAQVAAISAQGFQSGGYTGNMATDAVAGVVHGQEFVMTAAATRENRPMLEAMNRGAKGIAGNSSVGSGKSSGGNVIVENYGAIVEVERRSDGDIAIIARREAKAIVARDTPDVMAGAIRNPNSSYSKSLSSSTKTERRRS
jgi:cell fate (sporulation/competence/biofilm development) regulator YlbF (YheA/YmcA/DUF963 family)